MLHLLYTFGESKYYPYWVIILMGSSGINYVLKKPEDSDQYEPYVIPSKLMPCCIYPASLVNQMKSLMRYYVNIKYVLTSMII